MSLRVLLTTPYEPPGRTALSSQVDRGFGWCRTRSEIEGGENRDREGERDWDREFRYAGERWSMSQEEREDLDENGRVRSEKSQPSTADGRRKSRKGVGETEGTQTAVYMSIRWTEDPL